jgi:hypothetical protein
MGLAEVPALLKHVTIAIYRGDSIGSSGEAKFMHALKIARGVLVRDGYLTAESEKGDTAQIKLTSKGQSQNLKHMRDSPDKTREFDKLFERVATAVDGHGNDQSSDTPEDPEAEKERVHANKLRAGNKPNKKGQKRYISG